MINALVPASEFAIGAKHFSDTDTLLLSTTDATNVLITNGSLESMCQTE